MDKKSRVSFPMLAVMVLFFHAFLATASPAEEIEANTLVISSTNHTRMQPEIFYAFNASVKRIEPLLKMDFVLFNPFQHEVIEEGAKYQKKLKEFMALLNKCVAGVVALKKANPQTEELLTRIHNDIRRHPESWLAELHAKIEDLMKDFEFLVIESSDTYGAHPIFYKPGVTEVHTPEGANEKDVMETLYGLFFIDAAFKQNKPIWGACHGAQIGYLHAGGKLGRLFEYNADGYDVDFKKTSLKDAKVEIWHIHKTLNTQKKDSDYYEFGMAEYPVPVIFEDKKTHGEAMYMNKDFEHSLGMVEPIPKDIEVISYHPMSEYKKKNQKEIYQDNNDAFNKILKSQVLVDAYQYKTMIGTQYHPQYTYDDLETSLVFDYLVRQVMAQMTDKKEKNGKSFIY